MLITLPPTYPHQRLIDEHLTKNCGGWQRGMVVNFLDTQIALVEANEGMAIVPSFGLAICPHRRVVMSQLVDPVVNLEFHRISNRAKGMPPGAEEFTDFFNASIARWTRHAGGLYGRDALDRHRLEGHDANQAGRQVQSAKTSSSMGMRKSRLPTLEGREP
jgi:hypothetical protein